MKYYSFNCFDIELGLWCCAFSGDGLLCLFSRLVLRCGAQEVSEISILVVKDR